MFLKVVSFDLEIVPININQMPTADKCQIILCSFHFNYLYKFNISGKVHETKNIVLILTKNYENIEVRSDKIVCFFKEESKELYVLLEILKNNDVIIGYNINNFDIPYLIDRARVIGIKRINIGLSDTNLFYQRSETKGFSVTRISNATGKIIFDVLSLMKREDESNVFKKKYNLKKLTLEHVSKEILTINKLEFPINKMIKYWKDTDNIELRDEFISYCSRDSEIPLQLLTKFRLLDKFFTLSKACGKVVQEVINSIGSGAFVENLLLKEFRKYDRILPIRTKEGKLGQELEGAEVYNPILGLSKDIASVDYKCCIGDTLILTDKGLIKIKDIENMLNINVLSLNQNNEIEKRNLYFSMKSIIDFKNIGIFKTKCITLEFGYEIEGSLNHRILKIVNDHIKYVELRDLKINDNILLNIGSNIYGTLNIIESNIFFEIENDIYEKEVPWYILQSSKKDQCLFLLNLFKDNKYESKSKKMCNQIHVMLLNMGIISILEYNHSTQYYMISIYDCNTFTDINQFTKYNMITLKVKSIEDNKKELYDISINKTHNYISNGFISHNSLYPSIMIRHNICFSTLILDPLEKLGLTEDDIVVQTTEEGVPYARFIKREKYIGIIPRILTELLGTRAAQKKEMKKYEKGTPNYLLYDAGQNATKILLNSHYGYTGDTTAKVYSWAVATAVTTNGRKQIKKTWHMILNEIGKVKINEREFTFKIVMGDTDSSYIQIVSLDNQPVSRDEVIKSVMSILEKVNATLEKPMQLDFENYIERIIVVAKKRYVMLVVDDNGKKTITSKGVENVRRDWSNFSTVNMTKIIDFLLREKDIKVGIEKSVKLIREQAKLLREGKIDINDLILSNKLTQLITLYDNEEAHVKVAIKMKERGKSSEIGDRIQYIIVDNGKNLISDKAEEAEYVINNLYKFKIDNYYYLHKQLIAPPIRMLKHLGIREELLLVSLDDKQQGLMDF